MGIALHSLKFLVDAHRSGVRFDETLMLGRQNVFGAPGELEQVVARAGLLPAGNDPLELRRGGLPWSEPVFRALGARRVESMDASPIEAPTLVHDLNEPIPDALRSRFDCVYDGGTLEHVFNFPVALRSAMEMVKVGGHLLLDTAGNNLMGHGFYQFAPELYYSALSAENGFEVERVVAVENGARWYDVTSPRIVGHRVELTNARPVMLLVRARRVANVPIFGRAPQQSDYASLWASEGHAEPLPVRDRMLGVKRVLRRRAPALADMLQAALVRWRELRARRNATFANREAFRPAPD